MLLYNNISQPSLFVEKCRSYGFTKDDIQENLSVLLLSNNEYSKCDYSGIDKKIKANCTYNATLFLNPEAFNANIRQVYYRIEKEIKDTTNMYAVSVIKMSTMTKEEIEGLSRTMPFYIKLPKKYFADIKVAEKNDDIGTEMYKKLSQLLKKYP